MIRRKNLASAAAALLALSLSVGPIASAQAVAQEAIMLETIGAVRMASPQEVRRMNEDASRRLPAEQARAAVPARQRAAVAD